MGTWNNSAEDVLEILEEALNNIEGDFSSRTLNKVLKVLKYYPYVTDKIKGENKYTAMKRTLVKIDRKDL